MLDKRGIYSAVDIVSQALEEMAIEDAGSYLLIGFMNGNRRTGEQSRGKSESSQWAITRSMRLVWMNGWRLTRLRLDAFAFGY
jgi:hypothetical protein